MAKKGWMIGEVERGRRVVGGGGNEGGGGSCNTVGGERRQVESKRWE